MFSDVGFGSLTNALSEPRFPAGHVYLYILSYLLYKVPFLDA